MATQGTGGRQVRQWRRHLDGWSSRCIRGYLSQERKRLRMQDPGEG